MTSHSVHRRRPFCGWSVRWQASRPHPGSAGRRASSARPSTVHTLSPSCAACTGTCHGQHLVPLIPLVLTWPWCLAPPTSAGECVCLTGQSSRTWLLRRACCAWQGLFKRVLRQRCSTYAPAGQLPVLEKCVQRRAFIQHADDHTPFWVHADRRSHACSRTVSLARSRRAAAAIRPAPAKHAARGAQRWAGASATWWTRRR